MDDTTRLLNELCAGRSDAYDELLPLLYGELKSIAARQMKGERANHTLQPTALVNEAFVRLVNQRQVQWQGRAHFCAMAARIMRRILVDHARRHGAEKRGGGAHRIELQESLFAAGEGQNEVDLLDIDEVLTQLEDLNPRHRQIVEMRFFSGLTIEEIAAALDLSVSTIKNDWRAARAWLSAQLS